jgi:hypothetical protein
MSDIIFRAYFEPQEANTVWYSDVLSQLWHYGLRYHPYLGNDLHQSQARTWKEELQAHPQSLYVGESEPYEGTLGQWLEQVPSHVQGSLSAYDRWIHLFLTLRPHAQVSCQAIHPLEKLGKIEVSYSEGHFHKEGPSSSYPMPLFLQVWHGILHWSNVCCRIVQPLYACGFYENDGPADGFWYHQGEHDCIEQPLLQGKRPDLTQLVKYPMIQYFSPQLMQPSDVSGAGTSGQGQAQGTTTAPNTWYRNMSDGGMMQVCAAPPFHYGLGLAYNYLNLAREADDKEGLDEISDRLYMVSGELLKLYEKDLE